MSLGMPKIAFEPIKNANFYELVFVSIVHLLQDDLDIFGKVNVTVLKRKDKLRKRRKL
jgi:hypothetical protein